MADSDTVISFNCARYCCGILIQRREGNQGVYALEQLTVMCSHVPNKVQPMARYYSYYSNVSRGKRKKADARG
jgi:hypothetical protein